MKRHYFLSLLCLTMLLGEARSQVLSVSSNKPSQTWSASRKKTTTTNASVYGVFVGRTPCKEFSKEVDMEVSAACAKRKMGITLYYDSVTKKPTVYETRGMAKWSGKGRWHIVNGTPADAKAIVYKLDLGPGIFLYLLKGDDNVLFILDKNRNFLVGNANYSYTFNRCRN